MALEIGDINKKPGEMGGMSQAIYDALYKNLKGGFKNGLPKEVIDGWKKLAFAISTGVIEHIKSNMEINGINTSGKVAKMNFETTFSQSNDGTGHVK